MSKRPLRVGVVGVGFGTTVHVPAFQSEGVEVVAVCARRLERAEEAAQKFGIAKAMNSYEEMLALPELDAVSIATPPSAHRDQALAAFAAGKHVLCEKPFARNAREGAEMLAAAKKSGLTAMVAHEFRFTSGRAYAKELLDEGFIGAPRLARASMVLGFGPPAAQTPPPYNPQRDSAAEGGGMLFALGSHYIDGLRHWFGDVESVSATLTNFAPERMHDGAVVRADTDTCFILDLRFHNGTIAQMTAAAGALFGSDARVEVYGSEGALFLPQTGPNPPAHGIVRGARRGEAAVRDLPVPERLQPFADPRDDRLMPFRLLVRAFEAGIAQGNSPSPNFEDGLRCQEVLDAARLSASSGRRVQIQN